jgi:hypothetical protein
MLLRARDESVAKCERYKADEESDQNDGMRCSPLCDEPRFSERAAKKCSPAGEGRAIAPS